MLSPTPALVEPVGRVFDVQRCSIHDGPGVRTTVFLSGCGMRCAWCHNPESFSDAGARRVSVDEVLREVLRDRAFYEASGGGLTLSGGEPLLQPQFSRALLSAARDHGLHTCVQTAGFVPARALLDVMGLVDLFHFDLKHMDPAQHRALTGADLTTIHASFDLLLDRSAPVLPRLPVVPGINDDDDNVSRLVAFLRQRRVSRLQLVPYQRMYLAKYRQLGLAARCGDVEPPTRAHLAALAERMGAAGLEVAVDA